MELRRSIALALGLVPAMVGCSGRQLVAEGGEGDSGSGSAESDEDDGADASTTGPVGTSGTTSVGTTTVGTTGTTTVGSTTDVTTGPVSVSATWTSTDTGAEACPMPMDWLQWYGCVASAEGVSCGECNEPCRQALTSEFNGANGGSCWYEIDAILCGPDPAVPPGECCYLVQMYEAGCGEGRPYVCDGEAITAEAVARDDWAAALAATPPDCDPVLRRALAEAWCTSALFEHASVASFARFVLDLLALGAPPDLVADAQRAMGEEVEHARLCFALARRYGGEAVGPGPLQICETPRTPADVVRAAVIEGCVGETISATEVAIARDRAVDPLVRAVLERIAADEHRHAVLAWRFVRWAIDARPDLRSVARTAFAEALRSRAAAPLEAGDAVMFAHGRLGPRDRAEIADDVRAHVVAPCAAALALLSGPAHGVAAPAAVAPRASLPS